MVESTPPQPEPQVIASYRLGRVLGSGGMGVVYEATDLRDGSTVALKLLHVHLEADEAFRERFTREAHVAALLRSPYTVHLLDYGVEEGRFFLVMKFVDGDSLREILRSGPMEPARALRIAAQVARALEEGEARGVVHRDIKPDNVMLADGEMAQVMDFGIARQAGSLTLTATGAFVGTLTYAAPEAAGGTVDHRADIYSLGVALYHMLTGRPPFEGEMLEIMRQHSEAPMPLEQLSELPAAVVEVVARCMEKAPEARFQSVSELAGALEHLAEGVATGVEALSLPRTEVLEPGRSPTGALTVPLAATMDLGAPSVRRRFLPRMSMTSYDLVFRNNGDQPLELELQATSIGDACDFTLPDSVSVPPRAGTTVSLSVTPRRRRLRGPRQLRQFSVTASGGDGGSTLDVAGEFDDRPEGMLPYLMPPLFGVALIGVVVTFMALVRDRDSGGVPTPPGVATAAASLCPAVDPLCAGGRIVFGSERDGNLEIYVMNSDGTGLTRLTNHPGKDGDPSWSPDGARIVFESDRDGQFEIYTMDADGSDLTRLTFSNADEGFLNLEPAWSPDGGTIAFASNRAGNAHIYVMNPDGTEISRLTEIPGQGPEWSPDGGRIAFTGMDDSGNVDVHVVNIDGSDLTRLTRNPAADAEPAWSPDGTRIAFRSERDGNPEVYVMNADGSAPLRLTNNLAEDTEPAWSPDGTRITFRSFRDGSDDIYVMFEDGSSQVRLTTDPAADFTPVWTSGATPVTPGAPRTSGEIEAEGEVDYFTFDAEDGVTYIFLVQPDTLRDVQLFLWRTATLEIKLQEVRGVGSASTELAWTASFSGPVFVSVKSYSDATGSYSFGVLVRP